jgi:hypothetical protein
MGRRSHKQLLLEFHKHYGSSPLDVADMWYDLCYKENVLSKKKKSEKGFKRFLAAHYYLWARPKNTAMFASWFNMCKRLLLWAASVEVDWKDGGLAREED